MSTNPVTITAEPGTPFIDIVREFDAPVERVFAAHSTPELYSRWIGPRGYDTQVEELDMRAGGRYRFVQTDPSGDGPYAFNGVFHVVRRNEFSIQTFEYEGWPDVVSLESYAFESLPGGRSRVSTHSVFPSVEARDGIVSAGMERGVVEGYERLDELLIDI
ncbi:SRPBCC family protein [Cryobacterium fucosi]|uniref:Polyketide cyclase n=1 Tax=Cryobacterium fucosi TaxID=1259157 RepID=A0A4V3IUX0_9MICO|nr:SRPBCC family protein [Cryobacterium fucosi]TFD74366.1 polyketide cyclase [Cryobacterium fucosi]